MDPVSIDFDRIFENVSTESRELLSAALNESCPSFVKLLQDLSKQGDTSQNSTTPSENELNSSILSYGCCPPPKLVACVAFDDAVIKVLGDRGGFDEYFHQQYKTHCRPRLSTKIRSNQNLDSQTDTVYDNNNTSKEINSMVESQEYYEMNEMKSENNGTPREDSTTTGGTATATTGSSYIPHSEYNNSYETFSRLVLENWASIVSIGRARNTERSIDSSSSGSGASSTAQLPSRSSPTPLPAPENLTSALVQLRQIYPPSSSTATSNSTTTSSNGNSSNMNINSITTIASNPAVLLGKRGRYFLDIWEEEEFLQRNKLKAQFRMLHDWSDLFHQQQYDDNHDGCYRDWLVSKQMDIVSKLKNNTKFSAKRKKFSDPIFRNDRTGPDDREALSCILPPPVPVAIHHPAAWGIGTSAHPVRDYSSNTTGSNTNGSSNHSSINVHHIHPASCTGRIITETHHQKYRAEHHHSSTNSNTNSNTNSSNTDSSYYTSAEGCHTADSTKISKRKGNSRKSNTSQPNTTSTNASTDNENNTNNTEVSTSTSATNALNSCEDLDDFNLYAQQLHCELQRQEAANYARLTRLQTTLDLQNSALSLAQRRESMEKILYRAIQCIEPSNAERVVYAFKPTRGHGFSNRAHTEQGVYSDKTQLVQGVSNGYHSTTTGTSSSTTATNIFHSGVLKLDLQGKEIHPTNPKLSAASMLSSSSNQQTSRYNTRCANISDTVLSTLRPHDANSNSFRRDLLGAAAVRQVSHAAALTTVAMASSSGNGGHSHLVVDGEIEVFLQRRWQVATINRVLCDGDLARHVKVTPEDCTAMESVWIAVEDGRLAPCGTHLRVVKSAPAPAVSSQPDTRLPDTPQAMLTQPVKVADQPPLPAVLLQNVAATAHSSGQRAHIVTPEEPSGAVSLTQAASTAAARLVSASRAGGVGSNSNNSTSSTSYQRGRSEPLATTADRSLVASALLHLNSSSCSSSNKQGSSSSNSKSQQPPTDPRLQRRPQTLPYYASLEIANTATAAVNHHSAALYPVVRGSAFTSPTTTAAATTATANHQIAVAQQLWLQQRPSYFPTAPSSSSARVKLPLPLGATNPKDIIPAVTAYTPLTSVPQIPQYHRNNNNNMNLYGNNPNGHHAGSVPYEYEPDSGPEQRLPILDSVGAHSCTAPEPRLHSSTLAAAVAASTEIAIANNSNKQPPPTYIPGTAGVLNCTATADTVNAASKTGTFRLGPNGSITRN